MDANIFGSIGQGIAQGMERGIQNAYNIQQQGFNQRLQIQKMASEQQSNEIKKTQLELQTEQMRIQLDEYKKKQLNETASRAYASYMDDGNPRHLNNMLQESPDLRKLFQGVVRVDPLNPQSDEDKRLFESLGYSGDMTNPLVKKRFIKATMPDGSVTIGDMHNMGIGAGLWKNWTDDKLKARATEAEIAHKEASTKKEEAMAGYYESGGERKGTTALEQIKLRGALREEFDAQVGEELIQNPDLLYNAIQTGQTEIEIGGQKLPTAKAAKVMQGKETMSSTDRTYLDGLDDASKSFKVLKTKLQDPKMDWNAIAKVKSEIAAVTGTDWTKATPEEKAAMLQKFSFNSELQTAMASYIKAMSGAAVSDAEREFYKDTITKGNWAIKETALASIDGFIAGVDRSLTNKLDNLATQVPYDVLQRKKRMSGTQSPGNKPPIPSKTAVEGASEDYKTPPPLGPKVGDKAKFGDSIVTISKVNPDGSLEVILPDGTSKTLRGTK